MPDDAKDAAEWRKQEAEKQAKRDAKVKVDHEQRGLAYLESMEQVKNWKEADVNPLQKSSTPLLKRPAIPASLQLKDGSSNIFLMHDYKGSYLENGYEGCHGAIVDNEYYFLEQWQRVESFNYFTHARVSIPPASWINTGHRNGALVLGTFCVETGNGLPSSESKYLLDQEGGKYILADRLARMAICYGFDGWLMNIECSFDVQARPNVWNGGNALMDLLEQLRKGLQTLPSGGKVIWYNSGPPKFHIPVLLISTQV